MKCVRNSKLVCTNWEKCKNAITCYRVPKGIRKKLQENYKGIKVIK